MTKPLDLIETLASLTTAATQLAELEKVNAEVWSNLEFRKSIRVILENANEIVQVLEAANWLPIESAPRDGTNILGCDGEKMTAVYWNYFGYWELSVCGIYTEDAEWHPTHWRPLPAAPVAGKGEDSK
jgi:hypothetical protein